MLMLFTLFFGSYANFYFHFIIHSCWWHLCRMPWYVHYIHALKAASTIYLAMIQQIYLETVWILNLKLILRASSLLERVNTNEMRKKREVFLGEGGRPSKVAEGRHFLFDILYFWCILFNIWRRVDIYLVISSLWVLFPGGSHFFVSLWLFDLGYLGFFIGIKYFYDLLNFEINHFYRVGGCKYKVASLLKEEQKNCKF